MGRKEKKQTKHSKLRANTRECALVYPGESIKIIGGSKLKIFEANPDDRRHRTQFILAADDEAEPHLGIRIWFPYVSDTLDSVAVCQSNGQYHTNLHVDIKLNHGTWTTSVRHLTGQERRVLGAPSSGRDMILTIVMSEGHKADVAVGIKGPFRPDDRAVLYDNAPFEGFKTPAEIMEQDIFHLYLDADSFWDRAISNFAGDFQGNSIN